MYSLEKTGKTVEEAVKLALNELGCTLEQVVVNVIDPGSKGFLGLGSKKAIVSVVKKFDPEDIAKKFLYEMTSLMGIEINLETGLKDRNLNINLTGQNVGSLIGKRGQTLESIQYLTSLVVNKGKNPYINIILDIENYREKRKKALETLAISLSKKVKSSKKPVKLEPMTSWERRIIHGVLQSDKNISTYSQGEDPHRSIVINVK